MSAGGKETHTAARTHTEPARAHKAANPSRSSRESFCQNTSNSTTSWQGETKHPEPRAIQCTNHQEFALWTLACAEMLSCPLESSGQRGDCPCLSFVAPNMRRMYTISRASTWRLVTVAVGFGHIWEIGGVLFAVTDAGPRRT